MKEAKIELVIFDCDGTLIDSEYINIKSISDELLALGYSQFNMKYSQHFFVGCSIFDIRNTLKNLGVQDVNATIDKMRLDSYKIAQAKLKAIPYAEELIKSIKVKKCVASNGERETVLKFLTICNLRQYFPLEHIFTRESVAKPKPAPDMYLFASKAFGIAPENCLVIEDSVTGVKAARTAGMMVLGFTGAHAHYHPEIGDKLKEAGASAIIHSLKEVQRFL